MYDPGVRQPGSAPHVPRARHPAPPSGVCLLAGEFPPDAGGVGDYTARLAEALAALGVPVRVLTTRRPGRPTTRLHRPAGPAPSPRLPVRAGIPVRADVPAWDLRAWPIVADALGRLGPRPLLHIQYQAGAFGLQGAVNLLPLWVRAAIPRARVVTTFHDVRVPYLFPKAGPLRAAANRALAQLSHAAIFTEPADLAAVGLDGRGYLIPIGSNLDVRPPADFDRRARRAALGADEATLLIGYFGFLNSSKGAPSLPRALALLAAEGRPVRLVLIGAETGASDPTDLAQARLVRDLIRQLGVGHLITHTGRLSAEEVSAALLACDVLALPFRDGVSLRRGTLMAGLAHGLPIVSTYPPAASSLRPPGVPHSAEEPAPRSAQRSAPERAVLRGAGSVAPLQLRDGEELLLVPPDDPPALARAITRLADDPELRSRLAHNARAASAGIAWPEIARRTLAVYEAVFGGETTDDRRPATDRDARSWDSDYRPAADEGTT